MRWKSKKRAKLERDCAASLDEYRVQFSACQMIGCAHWGEEIHHIMRGPNKARTFCSWWALLHLCHDCHLSVGNTRTWDLASQLALKVLADASVWNDDVHNPMVCYDRAAACDILGGGENAVTEEDVWDALVRITRQHYLPGEQMSDADIRSYCEEHYGTFDTEIERLVNMFWSACEIYDIVPVR